MKSAAFTAKCWVTWYDIGHGVTQYTCFHPSWAAPVGLAWIVPTGSTAVLMWSFTHPRYRRLGVCSLLTKEILKSFKAIVTSGGSEEGGKAFLKARRYRYDKATDLHVLSRK